MKTSLIYSLSILFAFALSTACTSETSNQSTSDTSGHENHKSIPSEAGNPQFKDETTKEIYQHYIHLKSALVESNVSEAKAGAKALHTALTNAGNKKGATLASQIAAASDIKLQRNDFDALTAEVEIVIKSAGLKSGKIFKQYCPMAKEGDGAYWLASESDIKNPYYGDEMLECGEVKEEIK